MLIALREDYLAHLESLKGPMPSITQNRMRLARMTGAQALSAVVKPGGKLVTQEVAEAIVRFVAGGSELANAEIEPSLLSLVCRELNTARQAQGKSEISADLLAGSRDTILTEFYERARADQPAGVRRVIEDELLTESGYRESLAEE
ncbi:MAG: WD40 repeat domain-containing protein, partial [Gammaproteobacteria bacterium]